MNKNDKSKLRYFAVATVLSLVLLAFYYFSMNFTFFPIVMISYMVALAVLAFIYIVYNRAFSRKGVTEEMLPPEWDVEKKREFIEDGKRRLAKSKWMLMGIIALIVTFVVEAVTLFLIPLFSGWF
jgi:uncharacterized membrane protein